MSSVIGQPLDALDTPAAAARPRRRRRQPAAGCSTACRDRGVDVRVHFKSLKCGGLARYLAARGGDGFLCAKLNEAEVLADAGITDILIANQVVGADQAAPAGRAGPPVPGQRLRR